MMDLNSHWTNTSSEHELTELTQMSCIAIDNPTVEFPTRRYINSEFRFRLFLAAVLLSNPLC